MTQHTSRPVIAIIGGGFTGAAVALHLLRHFPPGEVRIVIFEPRAKLGAGLAYDTAEPVHRTNVPPLRMSVYPEDPEHFLRWLQATDAMRDDSQVMHTDGQPYPQRALFGQFMDSLLRPHVEAGTIEHWQTKAIDAVAADGGWVIKTEDNRQLRTWTAVLAVSHPPPALPAALRPLAGHSGLIADTTRAGAFDGIDASERILVVGNGLTAADTVAALKHRGHRGPILSLSRRGLRSKGHSPQEQEFEADFTTEPAKRASELLFRIRHTVKRAKADGLTWHPIINAVRTQNEDIWRALPVAERRRLARHARPFWDVHRFRVAPQVERVLDAAIADGSLSILAATIASAKAQDDGIEVEFKIRATRKTERHLFDRVIVTTGPAHGGILHTQPLLSSLSGAGKLIACPTGLGIACDEDANALNAAGRAEASLLIAGPLARGTFGELIGITQVAAHAAFVAGRIWTRWEERSERVPLRAGNLG